MAVNAKFDDVVITGKLTVNKLLIRNDKLLNITPQDRLTINTKNLYEFVGDRYLLFNKFSNSDYGYGMSIDHNMIQIGYGTKEQFNNNTVQDALKVTTEGVTVKATVEAIPSDVIAEMLQDL